MSRDNAQAVCVYVGINGAALNAKHAQLAMMHLTCVEAAPWVTELLVRPHWFAAKRVPSMEIVVASMLFQSQELMQPVANARAKTSGVDQVVAIALWDTTCRMLAERASLASTVTQIALEYVPLRRIARGMQLTRKGSYEQVASALARTTGKVRIAAYVPMVRILQQIVLHASLGTVGTQTAPERAQFPPTAAATRTTSQEQ